MSAPASRVRPSASCVAVPATCNNRCVKTHVAQLATRAVRYLEAGQGRPVVLLHAFPLSADQWLPQLMRPPAGARLIAPDLRGFRGAGPAFEADLDGVTIDDYARDVIELMAHLDIRDATIAGLSMGGYVALALFRLASALMSGLLLADTRATADTAEGKAARDRMQALVAREGAPGVAHEMLPKLLGETTRREQPDLADAVRHLIETNEAGAVAAAIGAMRDRPDSSSLLPAIACPVTIVCGEEDLLTPMADSEFMHGAISGSRLMRLPRAGHLSNLEAPQAFTDALAKVQA